MITGSHNPKNYNGFKIVINDSPVSGIEILDLISDEFVNLKNSGNEIVKQDIMDEYINEVMSQGKLKHQSNENCCRLWKWFCQVKLLLN